MFSSRPIFAFTILLLAAACSSSRVAKPSSNELDPLLDRWHQAAAKADSTGFFGFIADDGIYIGTDASERWTKPEFWTFAKPYFARGRAWDFRPYDRNIRVHPNGDVAWFSELLDTWMGVCRGSGVLIKTPQGWQLQQYHLSVTVPNDIISNFIELVEKHQGAGQK